MRGQGSKRGLVSSATRFCETNIEEQAACVGIMICAEELLLPWPTIA